MYTWIDGSWTVRNGGPVVVLFLRDESGNLKKIGTQGFKPYFYIEDLSGGSSVISADGKPLHMVRTHLPSDVPKERTKYPATWEADVLFDTRFIIDKGISYGCDIVNGTLEPCEVELNMPRFHYFDIEISCPPDAKIEPTKALYPVVSIATYDSFDKVDKAFVLCDYKDERAMLWDWIQYVEQTNPDVLTGWFSGNQVSRTGFDWPYLFFRTKQLGLRLKTRMGFASPFRSPGRQLIDMMDFFKVWSKPQGEYESYGLKNIAKEVAHFEYVDLGAKIQSYVQKNDWDSIKEYNVADVTALKKIAEETRLWWSFETIRKLAGIKLCDTTSRQRMIEIMMMRHGAGPMPTHVKKDKKAYKGGYVHDVPKGVHENVAVLDYSALYPMIILAYNISPDVQNTVPKIITLLMDEREKLREKRLAGKSTWADDTTETGLKFCANSFYGWMGAPSSRLYKPELAEKITRKGQELVKLAGTSLQDVWLYSDTDSTFITVRDIDHAIELNNQVNQTIQTWAEERGLDFGSRVKFEKFYRRILFKAKKRYFGWLTWKDGFEKDKIDYVGVETRRSDACKLTKELLEQFSELVLKEGKTDEAVDLIVKALYQVMRGEIPPTQVATPRGLHKTVYKVHNPWQEGVKNAEALLHRKLDSFQKPRLLYCTEPFREFCIDDNVTDEEIDKLGVKVDWKKEAEVTVVKKFDELCKIVQGEE